MCLENVQKLDSNSNSHAICQSSLSLLDHMGES